MVRIATFVGLALVIAQGTSQDSGAAQVDATSRFSWSRRRTTTTTAYPLATTPYPSDPTNQTVTDCFKAPWICSVHPFEGCFPTLGDLDVGYCVQPDDRWNEDCYENPGICGKWSWCQLTDHRSWDEGETSTKGHCRYYAKKCVACQSSRRDDLAWSVIPGLNDEAIISEDDGEFGNYFDRGTRCNPNLGLICANDIPSLPPTCLTQKKLPLTASGKPFEFPTKENMYSWGKRMMRMGAKNRQRQVLGLGPKDQQAQGAPRSEIHKGVNTILGALWNSELWGKFVPLTIESTYDEECCNWDSYRSKLSEFQLNRTHANYRNPLHPNDPIIGNAPPCVWCEFDNAYNDENPTIWKLVHALTFNIPTEVMSENQYQVLSSLPLWLREHLSCALCRSHIKEHLVDLGIPRTRMSADWAHFFWRAHNYVNEQAEVTRCGSQSCGWGAWQTPPTWECAGEYRYPWYVSWADAMEQWKVADSGSARHAFEI